MRIHLKALLIFFLSGWLFGLAGLVLAQRIGRAAPLFAGVIFGLGVAVAVVLSRVLESVTWDFSRWRAVLAFSLFIVSYPIGLMTMVLTTWAHEQLLPSSVATSGAADTGLLVGGALNALVISLGLRLLTRRPERYLPGFMMFTPLLAVLLGMIMPLDSSVSLGFPVFFVTMNALLTFLSGVWLLRGASMNSEAA